MGIVTPPSKVLVTGANGFVGVWVVRLLLEQGYYVRGTVRSEQKATYLKVRFAKYDDKLEIVVIPDMLVATAFDESVKGVQGILHMAAVVSLGGTYETIVKPSIVMTENILNSTLKYGTDVRRLTITSSAVALLQPQEPGYTYTDKDWNEYAIQEMKEKGDKSAYHIPYFAAKTMAERAAWEFYDKHQDEVKWQIETVLFPYAFGPQIHEGYTNGKPQSFLYNHLQDDKPVEYLGDYAGSWADVRDVALAHILSLQKDNVAGRRLLISAGAFSWQDVYDALASVQPPVEGVPSGVHGIPRKPYNEIDSSETNKILGMPKYHSLAESARDTVLSMRVPGSF